MCARAMVCGAVWHVCAVDVFVLGGRRGVFVIWYVWCTCDTLGMVCVCV